METENEPRSKGPVGINPVACDLTKANPVWMRRVARSGFLLLGVPNIIAFVLVACVSSLLFGWLPKPKIMATADVLSGTSSVLVGVLLLKILGINPSLWLPFLCTLWFDIHFLSNARLFQFLRAVTGLFLGWIAFQCF